MIGSLFFIKFQEFESKEKEIYYVQSERKPEVKYRVNFEDGTCTCSDFKHRGETCKHFYKIVMEKAIA